jgi:hypothetical protein
MVQAPTNTRSKLVVVAAPVTLVVPSVRQMLSRVVPVVEETAASRVKAPPGQVEPEEVQEIGPAAFRFNVGATILESVVSYVAVGNWEAQLAAAVNLAVPPTVVKVMTPVTVL